MIIINSISIDKKTLRKNILNNREKISEDLLNIKSKKMIEKLISTDIYKNSNKIMIYVSYGKEIITNELITYSLKQNKKVITPICNTKDNTLILAETKTFPEGFVKNKYGILELDNNKINEIHPEEIDLIISPGIAFTRKGERLGYGGGYYDRLYAKINKNTIIVALVLDEFLINNIPTDYYDKLVDYIITEKEFIKV